MKYDLVCIGSITKDLFLLTNRGKIFKTPKDKLAPQWLGFELGEKICIDDIVENVGGVATDIYQGTKKLGLKSMPLGPDTPAVSIIIVDKNSGERVIFYEKSSGQINLSHLKSLKTKWLSISSLTGDWSKEAGIILSYAKKNNVKLILAPSTSMIREGYKNFKKLLKIAAMIFLNRNEAIEIALQEKQKIEKIADLAKMLHKLGPQTICITDGRKGAWAIDRKKIFHQPIRKVKTVDATGAGDAFASGFLGFYLKGNPIEKSLQAGIINSANVVQYAGTTKGLLSKEEILKKI